MKRTPREAQSGSAVSSEAQRLLELLHALGSTTFRQYLWQKAAELELTYAQSQVLFYVGQHSGSHMGEVAKAFAVTLPAITQIVDRLEQKKFLARGTDPTDRRVYPLDLTDEGKTLVGELETLQTEGLERVLERMSTRDRHRVIKGLEALVEAAAQAQHEARDREHPRRLTSG
ncbi:MAG: MarR family transcriptional regulator [Candidatus Rokubacteria bacterium]|nr:MarR family transcriptional regulator [Candidatus Rokubacteria bacterium]